MKTFRFRHQLGLGLVELMVALVVSSLLLIGVTQIFVSSKMSYRTLDGYSRLQENGRFAVEVLSKNIRLAGYRSDILTNDATEFLVDSVYTNNNGQVIVGTDGASGSSDSITFRYQGSGDGIGNPDGLIEDCLGGLVDAGTGNAVSMIFRIDEANNELECRVDGGNFQPIVDGVENMQIVYGIDNTGDGFANQFLPANTPGLAWGNVVSVRIALLLNTVNRVSTQNDSQAYTLLSGANAVNIAAATDGLRRRRFMTTINLRNRVRLL